MIPSDGTHMQEISGGHALLHVAALSGSPRHCGLQSPRSYRACARPLVLHLSGDAREMIMRDSATCAREPCARANSLARVDNELKCRLRKVNLRKVLFAIVEDYTPGTG